MIHLQIHCLNSITYPYNSHVRQDRLKDEKTCKLLKNSQNTHLCLSVKLCSLSILISVFGFIGLISMIVNNVISSTFFLIFSPIFIMYTFTNKAYLVQLSWQQNSKSNQLCNRSIFCKHRSEKAFFTSSINRLRQRFFLSLLFFHLRRLLKRCFSLGLFDDTLWPGIAILWPSFCYGQLFSSAKQRAQSLSLNLIQAISMTLHI